MKHFIITRFNLKLWPHDKNRRLTRTDEWVKERFRLFETWCLPSIAAQTVKDFTWVLLFDRQTPAEEVEKVKAYQCLCPQIRALGVDCKENLHLDFKYTISEIATKLTKDSGEEDLVLTTYLDSDDALREDYVEKVQEVARRCKPNTFISFKNGVQLFEQLNIAFHLVYPENHFISYLESAKGNVNSVYLWSHVDINKHPDCEVIFIDDKPMWMEVVHGINVDNDIYLMKKTKLITQQDVLGPFGLKHLLSAHPRRTYFTSYIPRFFRQAVRRINYKLTGRHFWD